MNIRHEDRPRRNEILDFIRSFPEATFFHTPAWMEALSAAFESFRSRWIVAREGEGIVGLMPYIEAVRGPFRFMHALPFGTYGDPLSFDLQTRVRLLESFFSSARRPACLVARAHVLNATTTDIFPRGVDTKMDECRMIRLEDGFEKYWYTDVKNKKRQDCNRGERLGVTVRSLDSDDELAGLYNLYKVESHGWGGVHPYPRALFRELFARTEEGVLILGAFLDGELLGGHIDFYFGKTAQAWQAGMSERSSEYSAGALLVKHAVKEACGMGVTGFNLGSSGGNRGIIFFKESMGGGEFRFPVGEVSKRWWGWIRKR